MTNKQNYFTYTDNTSDNNDKIMENLHKQIIDGINVAGCEYYCDPHCKQVVDEDGCYVFLCAEDKNCHYKKWQYKEQQCNKLKEEVSLLKESNSKLQQIEDVNSLEKCYLQQIDQLKADLQDYQEWFDEFKSMFKYDGNEPDCNEELYYCVEETVKENNKLKQTLIEIKEIAEKLTDDYGHKVSNAKIILQKISEVMQ